MGTADSREVRRTPGGSHQRLSHSAADRDASRAAETESGLEDPKTETVATCADTSTEPSPPSTQPAALAHPPTLLPYERITGPASSRVFALDAGSVLHVRVIKADGRSVLLTVDG